MPSYQVVGKHIFRTSVVALQMGTRMDGSPNLVNQPGPMLRVEVGTVLDDVTPEELAAAPDRFALLDDAAAQAAREQQASVAGASLRGVHEPAAGHDAVVQKPPLTGDQVAGMKAAQAEVAKVTAAQAEQRAKLDQELAEAQTKAAETMAAATEQAQQTRMARGAPGGTSAPAAAQPPPASSRQRHE